MFLENKYTKWYFQLIDNAKTQNRSKNKKIYYESHHIIPKCMGGNDLVLLTGKEHFICHLLLCRMTLGENKHKMINALIKMAFWKSETQQRYTARSFSLVRKFIAEKNREKFKGKKHSQKTKEKMKGKCGKWKRESKHKEETSKRQKGKPLKWNSLQENDPQKILILEKISLNMKKYNPMFDIETKNKMKQTLRKKRWWTDGKNDVFSEVCPDGYNNGRCRNRKVKENA